MKFPKLCTFTILIFSIHQVCTSTGTTNMKFSTVISTISEMRDELLADHRFLRMLSDSSLPQEKRMSFMPYFTYFAMSFSDLMDSWVHVENPQNDLEERLNSAASEDNFHYNMYLHDIEQVAGYTIDRYGSYSAVTRHIWGADTTAVRQLVYTLILCMKKYDDPLITLASMEVVESVFEIHYRHVRQGGIDNYDYFGDVHGELEANHTQSTWMTGELSPLEDIDVSPIQIEQALEVAKKVLNGFNSAFDALYNLAMAEDTIRPEKYIVEGNPPIHGFPENHPNKRAKIASQFEKTEL